MYLDEGGNKQTDQIAVPQNQRSCELEIFNGENRKQREQYFVGDMCGQSCQNELSINLYKEALQKASIWKNRIHEVVYIVGTQFGFQSFNQDSSLEFVQKVQWYKYTPATIFVASDHLTYILLNNAFVRAFTQNPAIDEQLAFAISLLHLHNALFRTLKRWEKHVGFAPCLSTSLSAESLQSQQAIFVLLCEVSLQFLIWSEAANVRHLPEGVCFLFWTLRNSSEFLQLVRDTEQITERIWCQQDVDLIKLRCKVRQSYQGLISQVQFRFKLQGILKGDVLRYVEFVLHNQAEDLENVHKDLRDYTSNVIELCRHRCFGVEESIVDTFIVIVIELALNGDGGDFTNKIITPIVLYLTVEMDLKGEWDISQRNGYDDCNECFCDSQLIQKLIRIVLEKSVISKSDLYNKFMQLGSNPLKTCQEVWQDKFFKKQFVERRSWLMLFRAFFRVFAFHLCLFHAMLMLGFFGLDIQFVTTVTIVHSLLCAFVNLTEVWLNRGITFRQEYFDSNHSDKHILVEMPSLSIQNQQKQLQVTVNSTNPPSRSSSLENRSGIDLPYLPVVNLRITTDKNNDPNQIKSSTQRSSDSFSWSASASTQKRRSQITSMIKEVDVLQKESRPNSPNEFDLLNDDDLEQIQLQQQLWQSQESEYSNLLMQWGVIHSAALSKNFGFWGQICKSIVWFFISVVLLISFLCSSTIYRQIPQRIQWIGDYWVLVSGFYITLWFILFIFRILNNCVSFRFYWSEIFARKSSVERYMVQPQKITTLELLTNGLFWCLIFVVKICFDYYLLVRPLVESVGDIMTLQWLHTGDKTMPLFGVDSQIPSIDGDLIPVIIRFVPPFLVSILDTGIFYIVVTSCFGFFQGLIYSQLGLVNDWDGLVKCFHVAAKFWIEITSNSCRNIKSQEHQVIAKKKSKSLFRCSSVDQQLQQQNVSRSYVSKLMGMNQRQSCTQSQWSNYRTVWNAIQNDFRSRDLISNHELACLSFPSFSKEYELDELLGLVNIQTPLLPAFVYRHHLQQALGTVQHENDQAQSVLLELKCLMFWIFVQVGLLSTESYQVWMQVRIPFHINNNVELYRARSRALSCLVKLLRYISQTYEQMDIQWLRNISFRLVDNLQQVRQIFFENKQCHNDILNEFENALYQSKEDLDRLMSPLLPSQSVRELADFLRRILSVQESAMVPQNPTARHMLCFFVSSLFNVDLINTNSEQISLMPSFTTLIPHHKEEVLYSVMTPGLSRQISSYDLESYEGSHSWLPPSSRGSALGSFMGSSKESIVMKIARNISFSRFGKGGSGFLAELNSETDGNVSIMQYLQSVYPLEWKNFLERLEVQRVISTIEIQKEMVLWASYRGQLLSRTVRGILCYQDALALLARLENPQPENMEEQEYKDLIDIIVSSKFSLIVASQHYGIARKSSDNSDKQFSKSIEQLMQMHKSLKIAYIDKPDNKNCEYAVLVKYSDDFFEPLDLLEQLPHEIYRIRYPGIGSSRGIILGEGKPENQNHAIIFAFGDLLQTIDMNQDNNLAEALKIRNLVTSFQSLGGCKYNQIKNEPSVEIPVLSVALSSKSLQSIGSNEPNALGVVGFREYVFSDRVGALGSFAAATEFAFGTILQRVMSFPGNVRFHYGHPDVWNKLLVMSSGGVSKATRGFHISEDIFGGFNIVMRGDIVWFKEFVSIGKGREMRFDSVNRFEQKISTGNGEQALSRDIRRLGQQMDFFRLMSFYHSSVGFFLNTAMLMFSVTAHIWVLLFLHLTATPYIYSQDGQECIDFSSQQDYFAGIEFRQNSSAQTCSTLQDIVHTQGVFSSGYVIALGIFSMMPFTMEMILEIGILKTIAATFLQLAAGAILFFIFKQQTSAYYFTQDLNHGGAQYLATGRGFALDRLSFVQVYSQFARSHFYKGLQLLQFCIVLALLDMKEFIVSTWGTWIVAVALLFSPMWFNPFAFSMSRVKLDFEEWRAWTQGVMAPSTLHTWQSWNDEQLEQYRNTTSKQINFWSKRVQGMLLAIFPRALMILAALSKYKASWILNSWIIFMVSTSTMLLLLGLNVYTQRRVGFRQKRIYRSLAIAMFTILCLLYLRFYIGESGAINVQNCIKVIFAHLQFALLLHNVLLYAFPRQKWIQDIVDFGYLLLDCICGYIMFGLLFLLSYAQVVDKIQGALLFNMEFVKSKQRNKTLGKVVDQLRTFYDPDVINSPYPM